MNLLARLNKMEARAAAFDNSWTSRRLASVAKLACEESAMECVELMREGLCGSAIFEAKRATGFIEIRCVLVLPWLPNEDATKSRRGSFSVRFGSESAWTKKMAMAMLALAPSAIAARMLSERIWKETMARLRLDMEGTDAWGRRPIAAVEFDGIPAWRDRMAMREEHAALDEATSPAGVSPGDRPNSFRL